MSIHKNNSIMSNQDKTDLIKSKMEALLISNSADFDKALLEQLKKASEGDLPALQYFTTYLEGEPLQRSEIKHIKWRGDQ